MRTGSDGRRRGRRACAAAAAIVVLASCGDGERPVSDDAPAAAPEPVMRAVSGTAGITEAEIAQIVEEVMRPLFPVTKGIRLLGVTLSSLGEEDESPEETAPPQLSLTL